MTVQLFAHTYRDLKAFALLLILVVHAHGDTLSYVVVSNSNALRSSRTAVGTSSKLRAEMAHLACFCAPTIAASSVVKPPDGRAPAGA